MSEAPAKQEMGLAHPELDRLVSVMDTLRARCPWDVQQTHRSLVPYLIEETYETVEAIESGSSDDVREELGDLLLQVVFHAKIASERSDGFDIDDVAAGIADKLIARHPHVFPKGGRPPSDPPSAAHASVEGGRPPSDPPSAAHASASEDLHGVWERRKAVEKSRRSALDGIPEMSALARLTKIIGRSRSHRVPLDLPTEPVDAESLGADVLALVARAQASGIDAEQAVRDAMRTLERDVQAAESGLDRD